MFPFLCLCSPLANSIFFSLSLSLPPGYALGSQSVTRRDGQHRDAVTLKWSTPKATSLELQFCTSAYRVTPSNVS